ncbi:MAG: GNAT family N-acetyltransferase [Myxococcales bacterium]|nr:GNAT family N-acetyltransferase [Myxococcales bacterium]
MSEVEVRTCAARDAQDLVRLIGGFRDHLGAASPTDAQLQAQVPRALADPAIEFAIAWQGEVPVGFCQLRFATSVWVAGNEAHLEDLFTVPAARRQSVGRRLVRHAVARARERGALRLTLNTNEGNREAQALYRAEGLAPTTHARYPGGQEVLWSMRVGED